MSGIDEQIPEQKCPECGSTSFYKIVYGAITSRIGTEDRSYREGTFQENDREDWQCNDCYTRVDEELKYYILDIEEEFS